jgi:hypothetical protein
MAPIDAEAAIAAVRASQKARQPLRADHAVFANGADDDDLGETRLFFARSAREVVFF